MEKTEIKIESANSKMFGQLAPTGLFFRCALPAIITSVFGALYSVVDGVFAGRFLGEGALAAINLISPGATPEALQCGKEHPGNPIPSNSCQWLQWIFQQYCGLCHERGFEFIFAEIRWNDSCCSLFHRDVCG